MSAANPGPSAHDETPPNFVHDLVKEDIAAGKYGGNVRTRFPPEPNGFLHIGHAKSICLNFGAAELGGGGTCNLRFDDTNPAAESDEFVQSIQADVRWLGFDWQDRLYFASDYFSQLHEWATELVRTGKAYVDSQTPEQIREGRGNFYKLGTNSPHRDRSVEENLELFRGMAEGRFAEGEHVLRAKIDMASPNMNLRDPPIYRILKAAHHRTGTTWAIYPMYDFAHGLCDAIEGITHSVCTLEFENHRPLYDWFLEQLPVPCHPRQIEFARLNLTYTVLSKRMLQQLVNERHVESWDDPRMPTLAGMRRRGFTSAAIRRFCERIGVAKRDGVVEVTLLEHALREDLNAECPRAMAVLRPLKVVLTNFPEGHVEWIEAANHPEFPDRGTHQIALTRELYVEQDDYMQNPPKSFFRLGPGREVRLRYGCLITCTEALTDDGGNVVELRCTWDPATIGGNAPDGRRVKGTIHWVSASHSAPASVRLYDRLFRSENPAGADGGFLTQLNPDSLEELHNCRVESHLASAKPGDSFQFERLGYFCRDSAAGNHDSLTFNRTISLRDTWAKVAQRQE
jgi:glutaminyl-tRNA synthetase